MTDAAMTASPDLIDPVRRARVEALLAEYAHCIDDDRLEQWPDFFAQTCRYRVVTRENFDRDLPLSLIYCDSKGMLADRISALRTANIFEPHVYCHITGAARVWSEGGELRARSNFTIVRTMANGEASIFACGKYLDCVVEDAGALKFRERIAVLDSRQIDTLLVIPV